MKSRGKRWLAAGNNGAGFLRADGCRVSPCLKDVPGKIFVLDDWIEALMNVRSIDRMIVRLLFRRAER